MGTRRDRGRAGERFAAAYLELLGFEVLERNTRLAGVEVDLVAREASTTVLVEVKWRGRTDYGGAALAIDERKRQRLLRAARALAPSSPDVRVDVVAIEPDGDGVRLRHYRNAIHD
jgi:putative endonuclease